MFIVALQLPTSLTVIKDPGESPVLGCTLCQALLLELKRLVDQPVDAGKIADHADN